MLAERGLVGAGIVLCLVLGLAKQCLARLIALFVGGHSLRHPHAIPPALEAALASGAVRVEQRLLLRPLRGDLLLRLQVLLNCSSRFFLTVSIYWARASPMVMVQCTGEDGAEEGVGAGSSTTMFSIGTSLSSGCLSASRSTAMAAISRCQHGQRT